MTWRSDISSRALKTASVLAFVAAQLLASTVQGRVDLVDSHSSQVNRKENFAGVIVWLEPTGPQSSAPPKRHARIVQKNKTFKPHIVAITVGSSVDFPNFDPIFHNAFSNFEGQIFDIGLYAPGSSRSIRFDRPGIVRVFCNIHPAMSAIIAVLSSPYFAITNAAGSFTLPNVPPGSYQIHFFHERATPETLDRLVHTVVVEQSPVDLATTTISETGYLPVAHKNKYGNDYPIAAGQDSTYSNPIK